MTTQELDEFLVQEKERAEKALGCDMCKKYARCLYCFSKDEYRCAKAHERLVVVLERGNRKIPSYLLPEPPLPSAEEKPATEKKPQQELRRTVSAAPALTVRTKEEESEKEPKEEMIETIAHILSEYKMDSLSEERTQELMKISAMLDSQDEQEHKETPAAVLTRTKHEEGNVPLFVITRKRKYN